MIEGVIYRYKSPSGKYYIGQTIGEEERRHKFLHSDVYAGPKIDKARMKYGPENFEYTILMKVTGDNEEEVHNYLDILEIGFIRMYDSFNNGYNCTIGGGGRSGYSLSEDIKEKIRKKLIGHQAPNKGIPMSEEQKKKLSESLKGHTVWNKGIPMSDEQKKKLSDAHKGKPAPIKGRHRVYNPDGTYRMVK